MSIDSSRNGATRAAPSKINSTLCGEDPLGGDFGPSSLLLGCVRRRQERVGVFLSQETRTYSVSPMIQEVRPLLLTSYVPDVWRVGMEPVPVVVVFTKYDRLVNSKKAELHEEDKSLSEDSLRERSKQEALNVLDVCIQSLKSTADTLGNKETPQTPTPHHVSVSGIIFPSHCLFDPCLSGFPVRTGYEASISSLVQVTCKLVSDKLKLMLAIAQRASRQVKIHACVE